MFYQLFNLFFPGYNMFITVGNRKRKMKRVSWNERVFVYRAHSKKEYER